MISLVQNYSFRMCLPFTVRQFVLCMATKKCRFQIPVLSVNLPFSKPSVVISPLNSPSPWIFPLVSYIQTQNHSDLKEPLEVIQSQSPAKADSLQQVAQEGIQIGSDYFHNGVSTTSLCSLFQCSMTPFFSDVVLETSYVSIYVHCSLVCHWALLKRT